jgi:threonine/homoserine/homoserine lactone efflux protein
VATLREVTWSFLLTALVICVTPGTGALFTLAAALGRGARAGLLAAFACTIATVPHLLAAVTGLAALLQASGVAFQVVKYAGVVYLLWMAWSTWRDTGALRIDADDTPTSRRAVIVSAIGVNALNPKLTIFFFAFLPQFVPAGTDHELGWMLGLGAVFVLMTYLVFVGYALAAASVRQQVLTRPQVVQRVRRAFAACFVLLSGRLALETR